MTFPLLYFSILAGFASDSFVYLNEIEDRCIWKQNPAEPFVIFEHSLPCPSYGKVYKDGTLLFLQNNSLRIVSDTQMFLSYPKKNGDYSPNFRPYIGEEGQVFWPFYNSVEESIVLYTWYRDSKSWHKLDSLHNIPKWIAESHPEEIGMSLPLEKQSIGSFETVQFIPSTQILQNVTDFFSGKDEIPTSLVKWSEQYSYVTRRAVKSDEFAYLGLECKNGCIIKEVVFCRQNCSTLSKYKVGSIVISDAILLQGEKVSVWGKSTSIPQADRIGLLSTNEHILTQQNQNQSFKYIFDSNLSKEPLKIISTSSTPVLPDKLKVIIQQLSHEIIQIDSETAQEYIDAFVENKGDLGINFVFSDSSKFTLPSYLIKNPEPYNKIKTILYFKNASSASLAKDMEYKNIQCTYFSESHEFIAEKIGCEGRYSAYPMEEYKTLKEYEFLDYTTDFILTTLDQTSLNGIFLQERGTKTEIIYDGPTFDEYNILNSQSHHPFISQYAIDLEYAEKKNIQEETE